ncbi:MAG: vWA domain-containing protein [Gemmatimonadota bacterium]
MRAAVAGRLVTLLLGVVAPLSAQDIGPVSRLVACPEGPGSGCLVVPLTVPDDLDPAAAADPARWRARIGDAELPVSALAVDPTASPPLDLLVLVDASGSMAGGGLQFVRSALRVLIEQLPADARVAVAPFASRRVEERIDAAAFGPPQAAVARLDGLPAPDGNTGLYSAVAAGARRLQRERGTAARASVLLVVTDGRNDVGGAGDDPGLLRGGEGRAAARTELRAGGVEAWVLGAGAGVDPDELAALTTPGRSTVLSTTDPVALTGALTDMAAAWARGRRATVVVPAWAYDRMARGARPFTLTVDAGGEVRTVVEARWQPPRFVPPPIAGRPSVDRGSVSPVAARRAVLLAFWAGLLVLLAFPLDARFAAGPQPMRVERRAFRFFGRRQETPPDVLLDVEEAAPRDPREETASRARRR